MPDGPIVDSHLHLWDPGLFPMSWLDGLPTLNRPYSLADYQAASAGLNIEALVYVQVEVDPPDGLLEVQWAAEQAARDPRIQAIVAYAPLEHGARARRYLAALTALEPRVKGVRRIIQYEPDLDFCRRPGFVAGVRLLAEFGLSFDLCIDHRHLANTIELVQRCPEVSFILDHIGKPTIRASGLDPWRTQIGQLANLPNVLCKISGLVTEADLARWTPADLAPYVEHVLERFGEDRVVFGGDWPVVTLAAPYRRWVETLDSLTASLPAPARAKLWAGNARRFYRLPDPT